MVLIAGHNAGNRLMPEAVHLLDLTLETPEENLACDEALFLEKEKSGGSGVLRLWEPDRSFVVVGYTRSVTRDVRSDVCRSLGVPVLRRCTGGGTVVQMPGCLNYALILPLSSTGHFSTISSTNRMIMATLRNAIHPLKSPASLRVDGVSDLTTDGLKFAGNAQRRGKTFLLFHGVILNDADLGMISRLLPMPSHQPEYRQNRPHSAFLTNLHVPVYDLKRVLEKAWSAVPGEFPVPRSEIKHLVESKYTQESWIFKR